MKIAPDTIVNQLIRQYRQGYYEVLRNDVLAQLEIYTDDYRLCNLAAVCCHQLKYILEAESLYKRAIKLNPKFADAYVNLGVIYRETGKFQLAIDAYLQALSINPREGDAANNIGNLYLSLGSLVEAEAWLLKSLEINGGSGETHNNLGLVYRKLGLAEKALQCFLKAAEIAPTFIEPMINAGLVYQSDGKLLNALSLYNRALEVDPSDERVLSRKLYIHSCLCDWKEMAPFQDRIKQLGTSTHAVTPFSMLYLDADASRNQSRSQRYWKTIENLSINALDGKSAKRPNRCKIHIGYFSAELHSHAVTLLIKGMIKQHDRSTFKITGYNIGPLVEDDVFKEVNQNFDEFNDASKLSDRELVLKARAAEIDIAVDLSGFTRHGRPAVFKARVAPIQINYLGYPGTMGTKIYDYIVADKVVIPDTIRKYFDEKIIYLPDTYQVSDDSRPRHHRNQSREKRGVRDGEFVFCAFNNLVKVTEQEASVWAKLLQYKEGSSLWIASSERAAVKNFISFFVKRGIDHNRIRVIPYSSYAEYLETLSAADLFLDSFTFGAGATANDALWVGLPVVTKCGQSYTSRMASSLLTTLDLENLITHTVAEYEEVAKRLSRSDSDLSKIRSQLLDEQRRYELFDTERFTRNFESGLKRAYQRQSEKGEASDISV